jgi:hypothetical protein
MSDRRNLVRVPGGQVVRLVGEDQLGHGEGACVVPKREALTRCLDPVVACLRSVAGLRGILDCAE